MGLQKKLKGAVILILLLGWCVPTNAQDNAGSKKAQITFVYPLGTNGINSMDYANNVSFNLLVGLNGGVNGFEFGGLVNYNKGDVKGFQFGGLANINSGSTQGIQISGISNIANQNSKGLQMGLTNIVNGEHKGLQLGLFNYSKRLNGVQFGLINVSDSISSGTPVGLINIVKNGYKAVEVAGGETLWANASFKLGSREFYTIIKTGYSRFKDENVYSAGLGFGSLFSFAKKHGISLELSGNNILYDGKWSGLNILGKLDFNFQYSLNDRFKVIAGPSFNTYITDQEVDGNFGTLNIPYTIFEDINEDRMLSAWIGFNLGVALEL
nr:hypothetical protein [Allomuricauda sp.]